MRTLAVAALAALALFACKRAPAGPGDADVQSFVRAFYAAEQGKSHQQRQAARHVALSDELLHLFEVDETLQPLGAGCGLDFGPFDDAQDDVGSVREVSVLRVPDLRAEVYFTDPPTHHVTLVLEGTGTALRIHDVIYARESGATDQLLAMMRKNAADNDCKKEAEQEEE